MLCECGEHEATIHEVVIRNGKKLERHLCESCAAALGYDAGDSAGPEGSLLEHLSSIFGAAGFTESGVPEPLDVEPSDIDDIDEGDEYAMGLDEDAGGDAAGLEGESQAAGSPSESGSSEALSSKPESSEPSPAEPGPLEGSSSVKAGSSSGGTGQSASGAAGPGIGAPSPSKGRPVQPRTCRGCGMGFDEFRRAGLLGCPVCYESFETMLSPIIERAQNRGSHHVGKVPRFALERSRAAGSSASMLGGDEERLARLGLLRRQLSDAVKQEEYERAARVRDELQRLSSLSGLEAEDEPSGTRVERTDDDS